MKPMKPMKKHNTNNTTKCFVIQESSVKNNDWYDHPDCEIFDNFKTAIECYKKESSCGSVYTRATLSESDFRTAFRRLYDGGM